MTCQFLHLTGGELDRKDLLKKTLRFPIGQFQILGRYLYRLVPKLDFSYGKRHGTPTYDNYVNGRQRLMEEIGDGIMDFGRHDQVIVLQDQINVAGKIR
jgi:hypothetical protein